MSAALQFPLAFPSARPSRQARLQIAQPGRVNLAASAAVLPPSLLATAVHHIQRRLPRPELVQETVLGTDLGTDLGPVPDLDLDLNRAQGSLPGLLPELLPDLVPDLVQDLDPDQVAELLSEPDSEPINSWAFYRKHTENLLRRYLYASMQVGRSPNLLGESVGRGWVSSRRVRTFEDALIFVLDVERCLKRLRHWERQLITRRILQEYTSQETASILGMSLTSMTMKFAQALDHLTEILVETDLLALPD